MASDSMTTLIHTVFGGDKNVFDKIISDGKLKSSSKTKNVKLCGDNPDSKCGKYIFLRIDQKGDYGNFYLDYKLLLETNFYLHVGWTGEPTGEKINGRKLIIEQLDELLDNFKKEIKIFEKERKKAKRSRSFAKLLTNEILVEKNIDLKKYLKKIVLPDFDDKKTNQEIINKIKNLNSNIEIR